MSVQRPLFSIVTVCLNPGGDLPKTVASVLGQDYQRLEYIIKDGLSQDGTQRFSCSDPRVSFVSRPDRGIYDAMNQALGLCGGRYVNFMNAGDTFRLSNTLSEVARLLEEREFPDLLYVDRYNEKFDVVTHYPDTLSPWYLFRRPVCHQVLFVKRSALLSIGGFDTRYCVLADYESLMKLVLANRATYAHCPLVAVSYKDGGSSAATRNQLQKQSELSRIRQAYLTRVQRIVYGIMWRSTLPHVRIRLVRQGRMRWLGRVLYH